MKKTVGWSEDLGSKLKALRLAHKVKQIDLARSLGISPAYLNLIENNKRPMHVDVLEKLLDSERILHLRDVLSKVVVADPIRDFACRLVLATHPNTEFSTEGVKKFIRWGASPRAAQSLIKAARVRALSQGRAHVAFEDIRYFADEVLRFEQEGYQLPTVRQVGIGCGSLVPLLLVVLLLAAPRLVSGVANGHPVGFLVALSLGGLLLGTIAVVAGVPLRLTNRGIALLAISGTWRGRLLSLSRQLRKSPI